MRLRHEQFITYRGATIIEFVLVLGPLFLLIFGGAEMMRISFESVRLQHGLLSAVRQITVGGSTTGQAVFNSMLRDAPQGFRMTAISICIPECADCAGGVCPTCTTSCAALRSGPLSEQGLEPGGQYTMYADHQAMLWTDIPLPIHMHAQAVGRMEVDIGHPFGADE